jgi:hypothetical protein
VELSDHHSAWMVRRDGSYEAAKFGTHWRADRGSAYVGESTLGGMGAIQAKSM